MSLRARDGLAPVVALAMLLGAAGCATQAPEDGPPWTRGRLSLRVEATASRPAVDLLAGFELRGTADAGELRLETSIGTRLAAARWSPTDAVLTGGDGERRYADLESLSAEVFGEALPLRALPDWLGGRPWAAAASRAAAGGFSQAGWRIDLSRHGEGHVVATRAAAPAVVLRVRLDARDD